MPPGQLQALLIDGLQHSAVFLCQFALGQSIQIVGKAGSKRWEGHGVASPYLVGIVEEEENL